MVTGSTPLEVAKLSKHKKEQIFDHSIVLSCKVWCSLQDTIIAIPVWHFFIRGWSSFTFCSAKRHFSTSTLSNIISIDYSNMSIYLFCLKINGWRVEWIWVWQLWSWPFKSLEFPPLSYMGYLKKSNINTSIWQQLQVWRMFWKHIELDLKSKAGCFG